MVGMCSRNRLSSRIEWVEGSMGEFRSSRRSTVFPAQGVSPNRPIGAISLPPSGISGLDLLQPEELLAFHLVEPHLDEVPCFGQLRYHLELQGVYPPLRGLDLVEELLHGGLDLGTLDDRLHQVFIGGGGFIDGGGGPEETISPVNEALFHLR